MASYTQTLYLGSWKVPKLIQYDIQYNKLWGDDSGRDMDGTDYSTLIGFFPKLYVNVGSFDEDEMATFLQHVNKASFDIKWYDAEIKGMRTNVEYYINDYTISLKDAKRMRYNSFSFELVPVKKR